MLNKQISVEESGHLHIRANSLPVMSYISRDKNIKIGRNQGLFLKTMGMKRHLWPNFCKAWSRGETFYAHKRPNQPLETQIYYPVKASGDLK
jgi:hypothetical protein